MLSAESDDEKAALCGIEKMTEYFVSLEMPLQLRKFDLSQDSMDRLAKLCTFGQQRTIKSYVELDYDRIKEIFESCY